MTARKPRPAALSAATTAAQAVPCGRRSRGFTQHAGPVRRYGTTAKTQVNLLFPSRRPSRAADAVPAAVTCGHTRHCVGHGLLHSHGPRSRLRSRRRKQCQKSQPKQRQNWPVFVFRGSSLFPQVTAFLPPKWGKTCQYDLSHIPDLGFCRKPRDEPPNNSPAVLPAGVRFVFDNPAAATTPVFDKSPKLCIGPNSTTAHAA